MKSTWRSKLNLDFYGVSKGVNHVYNLNIYNNLNAKHRVSEAYIVGPHLMMNALNFKIEFQVTEGKTLKLLPKPE